MVVNLKEIKIPIYLGVIFGFIALVLACVGVGTPRWQVSYSDVPNNTMISGTTNFYYTCTTSTGICTNFGYFADSMVFLREASGLAIVGILFLAFGIVGANWIPFKFGSRKAVDTMYDPRRRDYHVLFFTSLFVYCLYSNVSCIS